MLEQVQWKLMDFGPNVEIDWISLDLRRNPDFAIEPFKEFLSDKSVEAPIRRRLNVLGATAHLRASIFSAMLTIFDQATNPIKLFQKLVLYSGEDLELAKSVQDKNRMVLVHQELGENGEWLKRVYRQIKPELNLALDVTFNFFLGFIEFKLVGME